MRILHGFAAILLVIALSLLSACGSPSLTDLTDPLNKQAVIDATNLALSQNNCTLAVQTIAPLYNSKYSDNDVRMITASAYACWAGVQLFPLTGTLASSAAQLAGGTLWQLLPQLFPSVSPAQDKVVEGAVLGIDALQSILQPGIPLLPTNEINAGGYNVGSLYVSDRTNDANFYLFFTSMAAIGGLQNRYGHPNVAAGYTKGNDLPWTTAALVDADGCNFASSVVNMVDALGATVNVMPTSMRAGAQQMQAIFAQAISDVCDLGCQDVAPAGAQALVYNAQGTWQVSGCNTKTSCAGCPAGLRDRTACKFNTVPTDQVSCAASGIVNLINSGLQPAGGIPGVAWK